MEILFYVILGIILLLFILLFIISFVCVRMYARPKANSYESSIEYLKDHNSYDYYEKQEKINYSITLRDNYEIPMQLVKNSKDKDSKKYVISVHGWTANTISNGKFTEFFDKLGYNVILYTQRAHYGNKKTICTMGIKESLDLMEIIDDTYKRYGENITLGLHGESMGAATVISSMRYKPNVKFIVEDCGYDKLYDVSCDQVKNVYHLPTFIVDFSGFVGKLIYGYNYNKVESTKDMNNSNVPLLIIHGSDDKLVNVKNAKSIYDKYNSYKEICIFDGIEHAMSGFYKREEYYKKVKEFLENINL